MEWRIILEWIEIKISMSSAAIEIVTGVLLNLGISGIIIEDDNEIQDILNSPLKYWDYVDEDLANRKNEEAFIKFYLSNDLIGKETLLSVEQELNKLKKSEFEFSLGSLDLISVNVDDEDWVNNWKKHYKTFKIGDNIIIKPAWEEKIYEEGIVFNIEPGHVFGTGLHQTTQLCIIELEKIINSDSEVLDLGCGTGILSIISRMLGAKYAYAVDIDHNAEKTAYYNAELNNIKENYFVYIGDVLEDDELREKMLRQKYNVVVVNIVADVIIGLLDFVNEILKSGGTFICSGIIDEREDDVLNALKSKNFEILSKSEKDGWVCIVSKAWRKNA